MPFNKILENQSVIVSLDVDNCFYDRLTQIIDAGFTTIEINSTSQELLAKVIKSYPHLKIGAGGIVTTSELEACYHANVHFATSPGFLSEIAQTANIYSMNYIPGIATISEAMAALSVGIESVRPYPADLSFCTLLNKYLPKLHLFPAEVEWDEAEHFLNCPNVRAVSLLNPDKKQLKALSLA